MTNAPVKLTENALKVLKWQRILLILSVLGVPTGTYFGFSTIAPIEGWWWIAYIGLSYLLTNIVFKAVLFCAVMLIYRADMNLIAEESAEMNFTAEEEEEDDVAPHDYIELTVITKSDNPIGHYLDAEIWEWIEFEVDGVAVIGRFEDTISPKQLDTFEIPDDCVLFPPGIMYRLEPKK